MPKMKTKRSAAKRLKRTGSGQLLRRQGWKSHLLETKPAQRRRRLRRPVLVSPVDARRLRPLVPYL
jgi:large subunit ribosomal protein L35